MKIISAPSDAPSSVPPPVSSGVGFRITQPARRMSLRILSTLDDSLGKTLDSRAIGAVGGEFFQLAAGAIGR
jgi:hypothetical protein